MKLVLLFLIIPAFSLSQKFSNEEIIKYQSQSKNVTIIRDNWGIPHIYGKTDADAVFGLLYAQCEDDFKRVEMNALENLGRISEATGEKDLYNDLQMRLIYDSAAAIKDYKNAPTWFVKLLDAAAAGVNYYLYKHPETKPAVLLRFKPWYQLMRTNGSISATNTGGISSEETKTFYSGKRFVNQSEIDPALFFKKPFQEVATGSNGFAVAPSKTKNKNAILYINPHVTFYFRSEMHMVSEEGLNVYGAVTWGQFFIFQGFNEHCGWMHTSGHADLADVYEEKVSHNREKLTYQYGDNYRTVTKKNITLSYKKGGEEIEQSFAVYYTHHGPVLASRNGKWLSLKENNRSLKGLMQSWLRTKTIGFEAFKKVMDLRSNTSDNTVFADDKGHIAYWHGNFIPKRNTKYDWSKPVDGTTTATEWKGIHTLDEIVHVYDPSTGFIQSCNSTPFTASGSASPDKNKYPAYMAPDVEQPRSINAIRLLSKENNFTLDKMIELGYNTHLAAFDVLLPSLFLGFDARNQTAGWNDIDQAIKILKDWNRESSVSSVATTIAITWAKKLEKIPLQENASNDVTDHFERMAKYISPEKKVTLLEEVIKDLHAKYGKWEIAWGDINRYQRISDDITPIFDDNKLSYPVGLASSVWGCLPSFATINPPGSKYNYGVNGNSFVAAVEFGKKVKAKSIVTGGEGMDPDSQHFLDQKGGYLNGKFKNVLFYKEDVLKHIEKQYHPGE